MKFDGSRATNDSMAIRIQCSCGARLEFDEAFAGRTIPCPDCSSPLAVTASVSQEPERIPGPVLAAYLCSLIGFFTLVGSLMGIFLGWWAQRSGTPEHGSRGRSFARAAVFLGVTGLGVTSTALFFLDRLGIDGWLRTAEWAGKLDYGVETIQGEDPLQVLVKRGDTLPMVHLRRPSSFWGRMGLPANPEVLPDDLILYQVAEDAHISCLLRSLDLENDLDTCRREGLRHFLNSQLVAFLSGKRTRSPDGPMPDPKKLKQLPGTEIQEFRIDLVLGGRSRTFLLRIHRHRSFLVVLAGGARTNRFEELEQVLRRTLDAVKIEN